MNSTIYAITYTYVRGTKEETQFVNLFFYVHQNSIFKEHDNQSISSLYY